MPVARQRPGFEVIDRTELRDDYVISVVVRKRTPLDLSDFNRAQDVITSELQRFVVGFAPKRT